jgi:hypothetical protein
VLFIAVPRPREEAWVVHAHVQLRCRPTAVGLPAVALLMQQRYCSTESSDGLHNRLLGRTGGSLSYGTPVCLTPFSIKLCQASFSWLRKERLDCEIRADFESSCYAGSLSKCSGRHCTFTFSGSTERDLVVLRGYLSGDVKEQHHLSPCMMRQTCINNSLAIVLLKVSFESFALLILGDPVSYLVVDSRCLYSTANPCPLHEWFHRKVAPLFSGLI